jgi:hypothetical protein
MIRTRTLGVVACLCAAWVTWEERALSTSVQSATSISAYSMPVSPSVVATVASRGKDLVVLALWRGAPRWYSGGGHRGASYSGGQSGVFGATLEYGDVGLDLSFDPAAHTATIRSVVTKVPPDANVLLIDGVDSRGGPRVSKALRVATGDANLDPRYGSLAPLLGLSPEVVAFLQCNDASYDPRSREPCNELNRR